MDDWVVLDDQNLSNDEEITVSFSRDPSDLIIALSSSDEKDLSNEGSDYDHDEDEGFYSDDSSTYAPEMADDDFVVPVANPKLERINRIAHLVFPRLPARTLLRFKSVSPNFNNLISSQFMVHSHFLHPKALSGVFYHNWDDICYLSFDAPLTNLPDPSLSYLPEPVSIKASTRGLLCVRGLDTFKFYVTNPTTKEWVDLPVPAPTLDNYDTNAVAVVIVFEEPSVYNFSGDYRVVCAYPIIEGVFSFMTFSSDKWAWTGSSEICDQVENIVAGSGTAVGAVAYWRTTFNSILSYDPGKDRLSTMQRPHYKMGEVWWELGEMDGQLSVTSQTDLKQIVVSTTAANNGENPSWKEMADFWLHGADVMPIRSQGLAKLVFWEENNNGRGLVLRDMKGQQVCSFEEPAYNRGFVPYISTLVPVKRSGAGTGTEPSVNKDDKIIQESVGNICSGDEASG